MARKRYTAEDIILKLREAAAGDIASPMRSVAIAVAQGAAAAYGINADLIDQDFS